MELNYKVRSVCDELKDIPIKQYIKRKKKEVKSIMYIVSQYLG